MKIKAMTFRTEILPSIGDLKKHELVYRAIGRETCSGNAFPVYFEFDSEKPIGFVKVEIGPDLNWYVSGELETYCVDVLYIVPCIEFTADSCKLRYFGATPTPEDKLLTPIERVFG